MIKNLSFAAFSIGLGIALWMTNKFLGSSLVAFLVCVTILLVYVIGFIELIRYQKATTLLSGQLQALNLPPENINQWLQALPTSLQHAVQRRLAGEAQGLPQPTLSHFLAGLLVMLGLLGTFIGMVETLKGAVIALETSDELQAIRQGLAQPMHGLSMAFGTSIAGVSASAMLGFIASLSKRQRVQASQLLDSKISQELAAFSLSFQRQQTFTALQQQASSLPDTAQSLNNAALQLQQFSEKMAQLLQSQQQAFSEQQQQQTEALSKQLQKDFQQHLNQSSGLIVNAISPEIQSLLSHLQQQTDSQLHALQQQSETQLSRFNQLSLQQTEQLQTQLQQQNAQATQQQQTLLQQFTQHLEQHITLFSEQQQHISLKQHNNLEALQQQWQTHCSALTESIGATLNKQQQEQQQQLESHVKGVQQLLSSTENLVQTRLENEQNMQQQAAEQFAALQQTLSEQLTKLTLQQQAGYQNNAKALEQLQTQAASNLQQLGQSLEAPMTKLIATASEAPKAASEVIEQLRNEISKNLARDNALLTERKKIMDELSQVSSDMAASAQSQRQAIEHIAGNAQQTLNQVADNFSQQLNQDSQQLNTAMAQFKDSALILEALGQAFEQGVSLFGESNEQLAQQLESLGQNLGAAGERSDQQMAYYVAQAREIIDHNISAQQHIIGQLQQLSKG